MNPYGRLLACLLLALAASACSGGDGGGGGSVSIAPVLTTVNPTSGIVSAAVTITGTDFGAEQGTGVVRFGGVGGVTVQSWTDTQIVAVVPDAFPGTRAVSVETAIGISNALDFQVVLPRAVYVWSDDATPVVAQSFSADGTGALAVLDSALTISINGALGFGFGGATNGIVLHAPTRRVYAAGLGSFAAFDVDPVTGSLSAATGSPVTVGTSNDFVYGVAVSSSGDVVWATEYSTCQIRPYAVAPAGFTEITGSPFLTGAATGCDAALPSADGGWLFQSNEAGDGLSSFSVAANGALTEVGSSPAALPGSVYQLTADPVRDRLYAPSAGFGALFALDVNLGTGAVTENVPLRVTLVGARATAVSADGSRLFASVSSGDLHVYDLNPGTGALTEVAGSPFVTGYGGLTALAVSADGSILYASDENGTGDQIAVFSVAPNGTLTELGGSPVPIVPGAGASTILTTF